MLVGVICSLISLYTVDTTSGGPFGQYRICNANEDTVISMPKAYPLLGSDWCTTVDNYFSKQSTTTQSFLYPCLYSSQTLRSQSDTALILFPDVQPRSRIYWTFKIPTAFVYVCVPLYIAGGIACHVLESRGWCQFPLSLSLYLGASPRSVVAICTRVFPLLSISDIALLLRKRFVDQNSKNQSTFRSHEGSID
jgi:hypothetical protein